MGGRGGIAFIDEAEHAHEARVPQRGKTRLDLLPHARRTYTKHMHTYDQTKPPGATEDRGEGAQAARGWQRVCLPRRTSEGNALSPHDMFIVRTSPKIVQVGVKARFEKSSTQNISLKLPAKVCRYSHPPRDVRRKTFRGGAHLWLASSPRRFRRVLLSRVPSFEREQ